MKALAEKLRRFIGQLISGGEYTGAVVAELPDAATGAALAMVIRASGALDAIETMEVLTSSELERALVKTMTYRPPGG
jgi:uncharacterized protein with GYD domain